MLALQEASSKSHPRARRSTRRGVLAVQEASSKSHPHAHDAAQKGVCWRCRRLPQNRTRAHDAAQGETDAQTPPPPHLAAMVILVALAAASATGAALLGVDDNPPASPSLCWRGRPRDGLRPPLALTPTLPPAQRSPTAPHRAPGRNRHRNRHLHHRTSPPRTHCPTAESIGPTLFLIIAFPAIPSILAGPTGALITRLAAQRP